MKTKPPFYGIIKSYVEIRYIIPLKNGIRIIVARHIKNSRRVLEHRSANRTNYQLLIIYKYFGGYGYEKDYK